jgi:hypothetical protein
MNFDNIGQNSLKEASSFKKIRTTSKTYTTNLVVADTAGAARFKKLHELYKNENSFLTSTNYSFLRQHNLLNTKALGGSVKPGLDRTSFNKFLEFNNLKRFNSGDTTSFHKNINFVQNSSLSDASTSLLLNLIKPSSTLISPHDLFTKYSNLTNTLNSDSDKSLHHYPLRKLLNTSLFGTKFSSLGSLKSTLFVNLETATNLTSTKVLTGQNTFDVSSLKARLYQAPNQVILPSDQNTRQYVNLTPTTTNFNFADSTFSPRSFNSGGFDIYSTAKAG